MAATKTITASALLAVAAFADETLTTYHMFEPKYTGLADKDAGDYEGELAFIFMTFKSYEASNPEAAIGQNVFEMSTVNVTGWTSMRCAMPQERRNVVQARPIAAQ